ncbi:probable calcium-binding protein CML45 [Musa acuminata AAA Group]|uniref:probable calcium-binding protein CML45 n=1 Tax=Musa acuminata AAA Group TaxID=214697 RepID=UPI0031E217A8
MARDEPPARNTRSQSRGDAQLDREDVEMVMDVMGLRCNREGEMEVSSDELSSLFEEETSLEEVKESFRVLDQKGAGFIDALEMQRVLTALGFVEGLELDAEG